MGRRRRFALPCPSRAARVAVIVALAGSVVSAALPGVAAAHPLGNFTINHYAGLFIERERVFLDLVIDQAEIPAFTARQALDADGDGETTDDELEAGRIAACEALAADLALAVDGVALTPVLLEAGLAFPPGVGGLQTMRTVCGLVADLPSALAPGGVARVSFSDGSFLDRIGWREIVVVGSGVAVTAVPGGGEARDASLTDRLTVYPPELVAQPLDDRALEVDVVADDATAVLPRPSIEDAEPVPGAPVVPPPGSPTPSDGGASPGPGASASVGPGASPEPGPSASGGPAVPGGVGGGDVPSIFREATLTPVVVLLSVLTALALGAGHALTPGHGKTLMAAYLVGTRGRPLHAVGLGLSVSISHTVGILVLAALVVGAADVLPADVVVRAAPVVASVSILGIGSWMLAGEWRRRRSVAATGDAGRDVGHAHVAAHEHSHAHAEAHEHAALEHPHPHAEAHQGPHEAVHEHPHGDAHEHPHAVANERQHPHEAAYEHPHDQAAGEHSHGGIRHNHLPVAGATITWRSLFVLGLAGGLIPSTSALLILLGSIAAGRTAFGLVLVVAFGLGMAAVMTGIGLVLVYARERLDRLPTSGRLTSAREAVPLIAAVVVFGFGLYLTYQALAGAPTF